ncbi:hypothetical protein BE221DRAFT_61710 [Ostreococcus tauri]|uniref:Centrosomal protein POC5 n=1 Tax=Ostreococcus tauri TaxID=70448 RepID=A0A1Y5HZS9_OSTTA|nr:hypothetical protein BE221DRAFT_61710 [Ostreococcus tauri]
MARASRTRREERAVNDEALVATFRELERELVGKARECARAVEANARRRDAQGEESVRVQWEETERWRAWCARARMQTLRCVDALARRAQTESTRRALRRWREAMKEANEERRVEITRRREVQRSVFASWRSLGRSARLRAARANSEATLTRETTFYDARCDDAVAKLAPRSDARVKRHTRSVESSESEVRRAFMRGVCALNLEAARVL